MCKILNNFGDNHHKSKQIQYPMFPASLFIAVWEKTACYYNHNKSKMCNKLTVWKGKKIPLQFTDKSFLCLIGCIQMM